LFSFTACTNGNNSVKNSSQSASQVMAVSNAQTNQKHIKKSLGTDISIDADVDSQNGVKAVKIIKAKALTVDKQKLVDTLIKPAKIIKTIQSGTGDSKTFEYDAVDSKLIVDSGIIFETTFCNDYLPYLLCTDKTASWYSADKYSKTSDLSFATRASAVAAITKMLKSFGVDISHTYEGYSLDYKTMEKVQKLDKNNKDIATNLKGEPIKIKESWSADDDFYYFVFHPQFGNLMIDQDNHGLNDDSTTYGSSINVCYSKRGVILLDSMFLYKQTDEESKATKIIDVNTAIQAVVNKFNTMIITDPIKITNVRLCYVASYIDSAHIDYNLVPAWRFDAEQTISAEKSSNAKTSTSDFDVVINAVTGKEM